MCREGKSRNVRLRIIVLKPPGRRLVRLDSPLLVPNLHLIHLRQILLLRRGAPEVAFERVVVDGRRQHAGGVLRVGLAVGFVRFGQGVGGVVGLVEVLGLDGGRALECLACFFACLFV